jgi:hypothetical protein
MWLWVQNSQDWWTWATMVFGPHIRPWEITTASRFWLSIKNPVPIFESSVQFKVGQGVTTHFWHDNWQQNILAIQFPNLYQNTRYTDVSVSDCYRDNHWYLHVRAQHQPQIQIEEERFH